MPVAPGRIDGTTGVAKALSELLPTLRRIIEANNVTPGNVAEWTEPTELDHDDLVEGERGEWLGRGLIFGREFCRFRLVRDL
jgi:hypothetical protein